MPLFSDDPVTVPFIPPLDDHEFENSYSYPPPPPSSSTEYTRSVIPTESDFSSVSDAGPNPYFSLRLYRYRPKRGGWKHISSADMAGERSAFPRPRPLPSSVRIITWNINYMRTVWDDRINGVLRHLEKVVASYDAKGEDSGYDGDACVILLQEVAPNMLEFMLNDEWVQRKWAITPTHQNKWPKNACFGNVTLVSRDLEVVKAQILHFSMSNQQRTGLLVYVRMAARGNEDESRIVCIANSHLESLPSGERHRPSQLEALVYMLKQEAIEGGVIAGDMNSISKSDRVVARKQGLKDAWRRGDTEAEGFTWGYQSLEEERKFPAARLDKVLYLPRRKYKVDEPERIGVGLSVETREGERHWVSDHYGLITTLHMTV